MHIKKVLFILLAISVTVTSLWAESNNPVFKKYPTSIGGFYGEIGGIGLSYQRWLYPLGFEVTGGLAYIPPETAYGPGENFFTYNIGFQLMYTIIANDITNWLSGNLYSFGGFIHYGYLTQPYSQTTDSNGGTTYTPDYSKSPVYSTDLGVGFGFGIETVLLEHFSFPLEFGLDGIWSLGNIYPKKAGFFIQSGFRYRF